MTERPEGTHTVEDVLALALPELLSHPDLCNRETGEVHKDVLTWLNHHALSWVLKQYEGHFPVPNISLVAIDWLVTGDPVKAEEFQPGHDCTDCAAGVLKVRAHLDEHPDSIVALANIKYEEAW